MRLEDVPSISLLSLDCCCFTTVSVLLSPTDTSILVIITVDFAAGYVSVYGVLYKYSPPLTTVRIS